MLTFESVKARLDRESPLSFIEFNYMILQAYDFLELNRRFRLRLADGGIGSMGQYSQRRRALPAGRPSRRVFGLTSDLLTTRIGRKMGKTRKRRGVALRRHAIALRLLAVLAEH